MQTVVNFHYDLHLFCFAPVVGVYAVFLTVLSFFHNMLKERGTTHSLSLTKSPGYI